MRQYWWNVLRALDILANTLTGGRVRTISARLGDKKISGTMNSFDKAIDWCLERIDPGHCLDSYEAWQVFTDRDGTEYKLEKVEK